MYMDDTAGSILDFTADCVQEARFTLTGTISLARGTDVLSGTNTLFNTELKAGDVLEVPTGSGSAVEKIVIESVTDNTTATYFCIQGGAVVNTSNTTRSTGTATFTATGAFTATTGSILSGSGSRTVVFKDHADNGYNGKATLTRTGNNTGTYPVNSGVANTDGASAGVAEVILISSNVTSVGAVRTRTKINDVNKNILLRKTVKKYAKSMLTVDNDGVSQTSYTFKKQFIVTSNASGQIVITVELMKHLTHYLIQII